MTYQFHLRTKALQYLVGFFSFFLRKKNILNFCFVKICIVLVYCIKTCSYFSLNKSSKELKKDNVPVLF